MDRLEELSEITLLDLRDSKRDRRRTLLDDLNHCMLVDLVEEASHKYAKRLTSTYYDHTVNCATCCFDISERLKGCSLRRGKNFEKAMTLISELRHLQDDVWPYAQCTDRSLLMGTADRRGIYGNLPAKFRNDLRSCLSMARSSA